MGTWELIDLPAPPAPTPQPHARFSDLDPAALPELPGMRSRRTPLHCRLRLWHTWRVHHVPGGGSYVACAGCGRDRTDPLFEPPY